MQQVSDYFYSDKTTQFGNPLLFWGGSLLVILGTLLHIPMFMSGADNGFRLVGTPMDHSMHLGMLLIPIGFIACVMGLIHKTSNFASTETIRIERLDTVPMNRAHLFLIIAMAVAITVDVMKVAALGFTIPGMSAEYGLRSPLTPTNTGWPASSLAIAAITGNILGSFLWGYLGDKIGRRGAIVLAGIGFIATSICGAMPEFYQNLIMCWFMGFAVGGMIPIVYSLLAEAIPAKHRGWIMVLIGADIAGAYLLTSWVAAALVPDYSWRVLWLIGAPTGIVFLLMHKWIPESPRFLISQGRLDEAEKVMAKYGALIVKEKIDNNKVENNISMSKWSDLFQKGVLGSSVAMIMLALGSGFGLYGFNLWIPTTLRQMGLSEADFIIRNAALIGLPVACVISMLYGLWSSKKTIIGLSMLTSISLILFAFMGQLMVEHRWLLYVLLVLPIAGISAILAVLSVYSAEVYPTSVRSRGTGFTSAMSKAGGVLIVTLVTLAVAPPSITVIALLGAIPLLISGIMVLIYAPETSKITLEKISSEAK